MVLVEVTRQSLNGVRIQTRSIGTQLKIQVILVLHPANPNPQQTTPQNGLVLAGTNILYLRSFVKTPNKTFAFTYNVKKINDLTTKLVVSLQSI